MDDGEKIQKKLYFMVERLKEFHSKLEHDIQSKIPLENLITMGRGIRERLSRQMLI